MRRDAAEVFEGPDGSTPDHRETKEERGTLLLRLQRAERTCRELHQRLRSLEHERAEIKSRLERMLSRLDALTAP